MSGFRKVIEKLIAQIGSKYDGIHCFREKERGRGIETDMIIKDLLYICQDNTWKSNFK